MDGQVDTLQHPGLTIAEGDVAELYLVLEAGQPARVQRFADVVLGRQYLVDALHRCQSLRYVVARL